MRVNRIHLLSVIIVSTILFPWIPVPAGLPELRPEWFILLIGITLMPISKKAVYSDISVIAATVSLSYLFSIFYGQVLMNILIDFRDFTLLMQPVLYLLFYLFCASASLNENQYHKLLRVLLLTLFVAALIAIVQFFNPAPIEPILQLFADKERIDEYVLFRATGTMGNANDLGFLMSIGFALSLFTSKHRILSRTFARILIVIFFLAVLASGSRTAMVCSAAILLTFIATEVRFNFKQLLLMLMLLSGLVWVFQSYFYELELAANLVARIMTLQNLAEDVGWNSRVNAALAALPLIAESLLFGHGPAKLVFSHGSNIDNEFILLLYRFGLFGTLATIGFMVSLAMQKKHHLIMSKPLFQSMYRLNWAILLAGFLFAYTAGLFMSFRLFGLLVVIWTITARVQFEPFQTNRVHQY